MRRLPALVALVAFGVLPLSACSGDAPASGFCGASDTVASFGGMSANFPGTRVLADAEAGDMTTLHEWGTSGGEAFRDRVTALERARDAAPTDEVARALDDLLAVVGPMASIYAAASEAPDLESFLDALDAIPAPDAADDDAANAAVALIEQAESETCD